MAKKNGITNAQALAAVCELIADCGNVELIDKIQHMAEVAAKPANKANYENSAQARATMNRARMVAATAANNPEKAWTNRELGEANGMEFLSNTGGISSQRVRCACDKAIKMGWLVKGDKVNGYQTYQATPEGVTEFDK